MSLQIFLFPFLLSWDSYLPDPSFSPTLSYDCWPFPICSELLYSLCLYIRLYLFCFAFFFVFFSSGKHNYQRYQIPFFFLFLFFLLHCWFFFLIFFFVFIYLFFVNSIHLVCSLCMLWCASLCQDLSSNTFVWPFTEDRPIKKNILQTYYHVIRK